MVQITCPTHQHTIVTKSNNPSFLKMAAIQSKSQNTLIKNFPKIHATSGKILHQCVRVEQEYSQVPNRRAYGMPHLGTYISKKNSNLSRFFLSTALLFIKISKKIQPCPFIRYNENGTLPSHFHVIKDFFYPGCFTKMSTRPCPFIGFSKYFSPPCLLGSKSLLGTCT